MKAIDQKCCVCREPAVERAFDNTAWCGIHLEDWKAFLRWERSRYPNPQAAFSAWLKQAVPVKDHEIMEGNDE